MLIRKCKKEDLEEILRIEYESFDHPYSSRIFEGYLHDDLFIVAEDEQGDVIGYIMAEENAEQGTILSIAVSPSDRLKGVGTALMDAVQKKMDVDSVFLTVRLSNKSAIDFYKTFKFRRIGILKEYYKNGEDCIVLKICVKGKD